MKKLILLLLLIPNLVIAETWICTNETRKFTFKRHGEKFIVNEIWYGKEDTIISDSYATLQIFHENDFSIWLIKDPEKIFWGMEIFQLDKVYGAQTRNKLRYRVLGHKWEDLFLEMPCGVSG
jgi:hypothetical protein